jgi:hypothetical protein
MVASISKTLLLAHRALSLTHAEVCSGKAIVYPERAVAIVLEPLLLRWYHPPALKDAISSAPGATARAEVCGWQGYHLSRAGGSAHVRAATAQTVSPVAGAGGR